MRYIGIILSLLLIPLFSFSPPTQSIQYVWAHSGLSIRSAPNKNAKRIGVANYGDAITVQTNGQSPTSMTIEEFQGFFIESQWVKVYWRGQAGYMFGGYLGQWKPIVKCVSEKACQNTQSLENYFKDTFSLKYEDHVTHTPDSPIDYEVKESLWVYDNGIEVRHTSPWEIGNSRSDIKIPKSVMSREEVYLLLYTAVRNSQLWEGGKRPAVGQEMQKEGTFSITADTMSSLYATVKTTHTHYIISGIYVSC